MHSACVITGECVEQDSGRRGFSRVARNEVALKGRGFQPRRN